VPGGHSFGDTPPAAWRDQARRASAHDLRSGLYPAGRAPVSPNTALTAIAVGGGVAVGGIAYGGSYFEPADTSSSSFSFSLAIGGGWSGFAFGYSSGGWYAPPCYAWQPGGGWAPYCGWAQPGWCGFGAAPFCRPWWCPPVWSDPWCSPVCWPAAYRPSFALFYGWPAYSTTFVYSVETFQPAPPQIVFVQPPAVVLASPDQAWSLLANGYDQQAMEDFAALASAQPGNPGHEVGYALAQAFLGLDDSASVAVRRAMSARAEALLLAPPDPSLRVRLEILSERLRDKARALSGTTPGRETLVLLAAVQTILYDNANAYFSINSAIEQGERDLGAFNLKAMLQARLAN